MLSETIRWTVRETASIDKTFTEQDLLRFADLSNDFNPLHLDHAYAKKSIFKQNIVHGMLTSSLISGLLGTQLPGHGTIYLSQNLKFKAPVFLNENVTAKVTIVEIIKEKSIILLETQVFNSKKEVVIDGQAAVKILK